MAFQADFRKKHVSLHAVVRKITENNSQKWGVHFLTSIIFLQKKYFFFPDPSSRLGENCLYSMDIRPLFCQNSLINKALLTILAFPGFT